MDLEGIVLTGGASRRMGSDKASLEVGGEPMALHVARELAGVAEKVTVLGREPLPGYGFQLDAEEFAGPHAALRRFEPSADFVFVASCDLPLFRGEVISEFRQRIGGAQALVPFLLGRLQPTCALYARSAFEALRSAPSEIRSLMAWLSRLDVQTVDEIALRRDHIDVAWLRGCNTREELDALVREEP